MTVLTQALSEKKLQSKAPNEIRQPLVDDNDDLPSAPQVDIENASTASLTSRRSRVQRINNLTTLCVTLTALLVLTTGIVGGIYLYRQFAQYRLRHFRGWCSIPYVDPSHEELIQSENENRDSLLDFGSINNVMNQLKNQRNDFFDEEFDIDLEFEEYEKIEVPDFSNGRKGRFIHDFSRNLTAIVDTQSRRCFIMPLNRTKVLPPQSLYDMVTKMRNGEYDIDTETVREVYRVSFPMVTDFKDMGYYIGRDCAKFQTYRLVRVNHIRRRSITPSKSPNVFKYFAGAGINEIQIEGIPSRPSN